MLHPPATDREIAAVRRSPMGNTPAGATGGRAHAARLNRAIGNQAVLNLIDRASSRNKTGESGSGCSGTNHGVRHDQIGASTLYRQAAGAGSTRSYPWDTGSLDATIEDRNKSECLGTVNIGGGLRFSKNCGNIKGPFCQPAGVDFGVDFFVDTTNGPRRGGFTPPTVRVQLVFVDTGGKVMQNIDKTDAKPRYTAPGTPLEPSFGHDFPFSTSEDGTLHVHLQLADPDSGTTINYVDAVSFTVIPCA